MQSGTAATAARMLRATGRRVTASVGTVRQVATDQPRVVLTYDDGPDPEGTPGVLRALADFGATATFFVLVRRARLYPSLLAEVMSAGHEIALHGFDHTRLTTLSPAETHRRTRDARTELEDRTGRPVTWFRAPYGALLLPHWTAVRRAGLVPVAWGPTVGDWRHLTEEELARDALAGSGRGEIVLAHDGYAGPEDCANDGPRPPLDRGRLASLLLTGLRERGLSARSLGDTLRDGRVRQWAWFKR